MYKHRLKRLNGNYILDIKITISKEFKVRLAIAVFLFRLAARILRCDINIETERIDCGI